MLAPNPTNDRLKFILKTYGEKKPWIVVDMVKIIAETVGADDWYGVLRASADDAEDGQFGRDLRDALLPSAQRRWEPSREFLVTLVDLVSLMPKLKTRHRADPIFPWMATQLAKIVPGYFTESADPYVDWVTKLKHGGTTLMLWYEAKRPNLGEYNLKDAWAEADHFVKHETPPPQGEIVAQLADGWTAQKLTTKDQLSIEGDQMQHCVGGYWASVRDGGTTIYSLRDKEGFPHVTVEVKNERVVQIQGIGDTPPADEFVPYVDEFKEWLEENNISTSRVPPHLTEYADALNEHGHDVEDEHLEIYAQDWYEHVSDAESAAEWLKSGMSYSEAELAGALESENVTPAEYVKFPYAVHQKIVEQGGVPRDLDKLVAVARMAIELQKLAPLRLDTPPLSSSRQIDLFEPEPEPPLSLPRRVPGHEPTGKLEGVKHRWRDTASPRWPSIDFQTWDDDHHYGDDYSDIEWLYPAEEWLAADFKSDPDEDEYVGPWFLNRFTPDQAEAWRDAGTDDGYLATELRTWRVTPAIIAEAEEKDAGEIFALSKEFDALKAKASWESAKKPLKEGLSEEEKTREGEIEAARLRSEIARYAKVIAEQIAEQIDDLGFVRRNPKRPKRTSKKRTSHRR